MIKRKSKILLVLLLIIMGVIFSIVWFSKSYFRQSNDSPRDPIIAHDGNASISMYYKTEDDGSTTNITEDEFNEIKKDTSK